MSNLGYTLRAVRLTRRIIPLAKVDLGHELMDSAQVSADPSLAKSDYTCLGAVAGPVLCARANNEKTPRTRSWNLCYSCSGSACETKSRRRALVLRDCSMTSLTPPARRQRTQLELANESRCTINHDRTRRMHAETIPIRQVRSEITDLPEMCKGIQERYTPQS